MNSNLKLAIIGPYPPPYGGISVHIQRMHRLLEEKKIEHAVYSTTNTRQPDVINMTKNWRFLKYLFTGKEDLAHFHNISMSKIVLLALLGLFGRKFIFTIHNDRLNDQIVKSNRLKKNVIIWAMRQIRLIVVNEEIKRSFVTLGIKPDHVDYISPFIPPSISNEDASDIPKEIWRFMESHDPVISANAFRISFYNGQDLYGLDMCVDLCSRLKKKYANIGFVFCLPEIGDNEYYNKILKNIKKEKIGDNFIFQTKPCQMYPIIMKSHVFVRPTNTDGFGVSVAEAIYFKIPAVASDVCPRAEGTILFRNRNIDDLTLKVQDILEHRKQHKERLESIEVVDNFNRVLEIYQKLARNPVNEY